MQNYCDEKIRNFCLVGHAGTGKTTITDQMLYKAAVTTRCGSVNDGTSTSDFRLEEKERKNSIFAAPLHCEWNDHLFHFIDTPGYTDFQGDQISAMSTCDGTIYVIDAINGIETGTIRAWKHTKSKARAFIINALDKERANFWETLEKLQENYGANRCVPITIPADNELSSVISILNPQNVPNELSDKVSAYREIIMDTIAEHDDTIMERYLSGETLSESEIAQGLHCAINDSSLIPVFAMSATNDVGITEFMNGIINLMPRPWNGRFPDHVDGSSFKYSADGDFVARAFKSINDPYIGQLTYIRIYSGMLKADSEVYNISKNCKERVGQLLFVNGKNTTPISQAGPGCIVAIAKLKATANGDTLACKPNASEIVHITYPTPTVSHSVYPLKKGDEEKIAAALQKLADEDQTITLKQQNETHELICSAMGDLQFAIIEHRLNNEFKIELDFRTPKVPYRETITKSASGFYRHKKQSGGAGQFGEVHLRVEPSNEIYEFTTEVVGGAIPKNFFPAIDKGVREALLEGPIANCNIINVKCVVFDGKYHNVDSNEMAFKLAGRMAFKEVIKNCNPILLEPIMQMKIYVPDEYVGDVTGDVSVRRGRIIGLSVEDGLQVLDVEVPMVETFTYSQSLRSITQGKGSFEMQFNRYEQVPTSLAAQIQKELVNHCDK
ncbi:MAG: elongation factor G [Lentisphaeria bacterium]